MFSSEEAFALQHISINCYPAPDLMFSCSSQYVHVSSSPEEWFLSQTPVSRVRTYSELHDETDIADTTLHIRAMLQLPQLMLICCLWSRVCRSAGMLVFGIRQNPRHPLDEQISIMLTCIMCCRVIAQLCIMYVLLNIPI